MLEQAIEACPNEFWNDEQEFWYKAYHTLFYLDYYLAYRVTIRHCKTHYNNEFTHLPFFITNTTREMCK